MCATLHITGFMSRARELPSPFGWCDIFFDLNKELLKEYERAEDERSIVRIEIEHGFEKSGTDA